MFTHLFCLRRDITAACGFLAVLTFSLSANDATWAFEPERDSFSPNALLDLSYLNEDVAGQHGFLSINEDGDFILGNGENMRVWAINTNVEREKPFRRRPRGRTTEPSLEYHAKFMAKRGVNMVRLHAHINPDPARPINSVNQGEIDWIWRTVAAMKQEGIYTTVSPYWANTMKIGSNWGTDWGDQTHNLLFIDEVLQVAYFEWLRKLLAEKNPYTGIPLAKDPALGIFQIQNEDSLLFWTFNNLKGAPRERFKEKFHKWVVDKYGSLAKAKSAWGSNSDVKGDADGSLELLNIYTMTENGLKQFNRKRKADQLEFMTRTMHRFNQKVEDFIREDLDSEVLINAGNWKTADDIYLNDAERWSYTANEVLAVNRYYSGIHKGPHRGWAIVNGDLFTEQSVVTDPAKFPLNLKQVKGHPMMITESSWVMPLNTGSEGPFLVAAYGALTGFDSFYWFATGDDGWTHPKSANGYLPSQTKWTFAYPDMLGTFPAAALMFRKDYLKRGEPVVVERRSLEDIWNLRSPIIAEKSGWDPNRDKGDFAPDSSVKEGVPSEAFMVGPVLVDYDANPRATEVTDLDPYLDDGGKTIKSNTGQIVLNSALGYCTVDAPKAQGVTGHFDKVSRHQLSNVIIDAQNDFGSVLVVSMDDQPIADSGKILIQVGTQSRPTGWKQEPATVDGQEGFKIADYGQAPWQVEQAQATIYIQNSDLSKATVLDMNGMPAGNVSLKRAGSAIRLDFPKDAMYVVLQ